MTLYIDPGTGSMLFTILIGIIGAGIYSLRMLLIKLRFALSGGKLSGVIGLIGRNTLAVYYLHWIMGLTVLQLVSVQGSFAVNLIKAAVMVLACSLLGEGLRRIPVLRRLL